MGCRSHCAGKRSGIRACPVLLLVAALPAVACARGKSTAKPEPAASAPENAASATAAPRTPKTEPGIPAVPDPNFHVFLLLGQSNMWGVPPPEAVDREAHPRVKVLAYEDCPALGRRYGQWYPATPPLHGCNGGVGPGDGFGKAYAAARPGVTVGLVPLAIGGAQIALFEKGVVAGDRSEFRIPPDDHWAGAYDWVLDRARLARNWGPIRGILLHQGESDAHFNTEWEHHVNGLVSALRADLELAPALPVVAGELLPDGCCGAFNVHIRALSSLLPRAAVVSSARLTGMDVWHFDLASQRALGRRYAEQLLALMPR